MGAPYSVETVRFLERVFQDQRLFRPFRRRRYERGNVLAYDVRGVLPDGRGRIKLEIERFVGGGYAGQVYKTRLLEFEKTDGDIQGLEIGRTYALKILIPASGMSRRIRNAFYALGFQGPFSLQVTPAAGRSQALWQKFIRRAAEEEFGSPDCVVDILATLVDRDLGGCGELSEWVDGRTWRFEVDDDLDARRAWKPGRPDEGLGSPEYRAKRSFMDGLVKMMRRMGAVELARQYEWWSLKSQPNALKRISTDADPRGGLVAVDFRAGMALTPVTPQCPADVKLVVQGLARGRLVQFDKGDIAKLEKYVSERPAAFAGMEGGLADLEREDRVYRDSLIDVTYHHVRLFGRKLRHSIMNGFRESWRVRNMTDERTNARLEKSGLLSFIFLLWPGLALAAPLLFILDWPGAVWWKYPVWLVPLVLVPFLRRLWGRADLRRHYAKMAASPRYFLRASRARIAEALVRWHRAGRVSAERAAKIAAQPWRYYLHLPFSFLPVGLHRFLTDEAYFKERLFYIFIRPVRLYFRADEREKWLLDMIAQGERNHMLLPAEAGRIRAQIKEPFIQKYLKSLAVHVCTLPITQVVSVALAFIYVRTHPELSWQQASVAAGMILALFQVIPISPGSFTRGLYTTFLVLKERNFRDYKVAFGLSYFKYIGYLAFPIQMAYRYPDLARFMAGHWATGAVHIVPVFGEKGAWLEHFAFDLFYNFPLTVQRRMRLRAERRAGKKARARHALPVILAGGAVFGLLDYAFYRIRGVVPAFGDVWWLAVFVPLLAAAVVARGAGGMSVGKRVGWGVVMGIVLGILNVAVGMALSSVLAGGSLWAPFVSDLGKFALGSVWRAFLFALVSGLGGFIAETRKVRG